MKKYFCTILVLVFALVAILIILPFTNKEENNCVDDIDLKEIYNSINLSTGIMFEEVSPSQIIEYIDVDVSKSKDYILAANVENKDEFYLITKDLSDDQLEYLKTIVDLKKTKSKDNFKDTTVSSYSGFSYVAFSNEHNYIIEGVIRSYLYCE